ncbi:MAG: DsrH/TusB family sulfur relay protein [Methylococcaceae bacterium]|nr:DsrH/TusB family sulfur relay protein [Methylococcaceae bacterium]
MIHIINNFPISPSFFDRTQFGDTVIFTDNAVFAVKQENLETESLTQKAFNHINLYVRKADLIIRNISNTELLRGVVIIDDMQYELAISEDFLIRSCN